MEDEVKNKKTKMEDEAILLLEVGLSTSRVPNPKPARWILHVLPLNC